MCVRDFAGFATNGLGHQYLDGRVSPPLTPQWHHDASGTQILGVRTDSVHDVGGGQ